MQILKILYIGLLLSPFTILGQTTFYKVYSSGNFDIGEGICQLADSSYLVTGSSGGFNTTSPQAFVMKVSKKGEQLWTVDKGGEEAETGRRIFYINDTIYLFGRTNSFGNSYDYYFLKLDSLGNTIDEKVIGTPEYEWLQDVVFLPKDSSFVLYGYWQENDGFSKKRQLIKIDRSGNVLWQKEYPMHLEAQLKNMHAVNDSVFGITGSEHNSSSHHFDGLFYSFSYQGNIIDSVLFPAQTGRDMCFNDFVFHANKFILIGYSELHQNGEIYMDNRTISYNPITFQLYIPSPGVGENLKTKIEYIIKKPSTINYFYTIERAKLGAFTTFSDNYWDEQVNLFYEFNDTLIWEKGVTNISRPGDDITNQVIQTLDNGVIIVGYNEAFANDAQNVFLVKIGNNDEAPSLVDHPEEESLLKIIQNDNISPVSIYPNPVSTQLFIALNDDFDAIIYNLNGSIVMQSTEAIIDVSTFPSGMYMLKIISNNSSTTVRFMKE